MCHHKFRSRLLQVRWQSLTIPSLPSRRCNRRWFVALSADGYKLANLLRGTLCTQARRRKSFKPNNRAVAPRLSHRVCRCDASSTAGMRGRPPPRLPIVPSVSMTMPTPTPVRGPFRPNPAHNPRDPLGRYNPHKTPEPPDSQEVFVASIFEDGAWYGRSRQNGRIYHYYNDSVGGFHFTGHTGSGPRDTPLNDIPIRVRRALGVVR